MAKFAKFNTKSVGNSLTDVAHGSPLFGAQRLSKTVKMLPHETLLYERHEHPGYDSYVLRQTDVSVLLQQEKFAQIYGAGYVNSVLNSSTRKASAVQSARDNLSDDELLASIIPRNIQSPSEVKSYMEEQLYNVQSLEGEAQDAVDSAAAARRATELAKQQQQQQSQQSES